jgi:hypothetical protein
VGEGLGDALGEPLGDGDGLAPPLNTPDKMVPPLRVTDIVDPAAITGTVSFSSLLSRSRASPLSITIVPAATPSTTTVSHVPFPTLTWRTRTSSSVRLLWISYWPKPVGTTPFNVGPVIHAKNSPALGEALGLGLGLVFGEPVGLGLALGLADGLGLALGEAEGLGLALGLADGLGLALGEADGLGLALGEAEGLADGDGLALGEADGLGLADGLADGDGLALGEADGLTDGEGLGLPEGLPEGDGLGEPDGLPEGLGDGLGGWLFEKTPFTRTPAPLRTSAESPTFMIGTCCPSCVLILM